MKRTLHQANLSVSETIDLIKKRNGNVVPFDIKRIEIAIQKAFKETKELENTEKVMETGVDGPPEGAQIAFLPIGFRADVSLETVSRDLAKQVKRELLERDVEVTVENCQDTVETILMKAGYFITAKAYILYRQKQAEKRAERKMVEIPEELIRLNKESAASFPSTLALSTALRTYARFDEAKGRRETWREIVDRYMINMRKKLGDKLTETEYTLVDKAIFTKKVMPSMRLLQFAGEAVDRENLCAYNCCFVAIESIKDMVDTMYVLMNGTGVGFSVEEQFISQLPKVEKQGNTKVSTFVIPDSKEGWCDAFHIGLTAWFSGRDVKFDYRRIRPKGARLRVMSGRASGPAPLRDLLDFARRKILGSQDQKLRSIDVHDIMCKVGAIVVVGGTRRSAMISLGDLRDTDHRDCKKFGFWNLEDQKQRSMANNSAVYNSKPDNLELLTEFHLLMVNNSGERGIFNRYGIFQQMPERRQKYLKKIGQDTKFGVNPCGEIPLPSHGLCNLSSIKCEPMDTPDTLEEKMKIAVIIGTYQATLTDFKYVSEKFKEMAEAERLLGVSLTGQMECPVVREPWVLKGLRESSIHWNEVYAARFGITPANAITTVKPEGTLSLVVGSTWGIHPAHGDYYIRRVQYSRHDPLAQLMMDEMKKAGVEYVHPYDGPTFDDCDTVTFEFPERAAPGAITREQLSALEMLEYWKKVRINYTEHNPSVTINVRKNEWIGVLNWLDQNWDYVGGIAFLPYDDHIYRLAPLESITKERYEEMAANFPKMDFSKLVLYEKEDKTSRKEVAACDGDICMMK